MRWTRNLAKTATSLGLVLALCSSTALAGTPGTSPKNPNATPSANRQAPAQQTGRSIAYVDDDAPAGGSGASWATAYQYLQDAIAAGATDIRVAGGTYQPDQGAAQTPGDPAATFSINGITITGGYAGLANTDGNINNPALYETILTGNLDGATAGNVVFITGGNPGSPATLQKCTVRDGNRGISIGTTPTYVEVAYCLITQNGPGGGHNGGGAVVWTEATGSIHDTYFINNAVNGFGGGLSILSASFEVVDCYFYDNYAQVYDSYPPNQNWLGGGGGLYVSTNDTVSGSVTVRGCEMIGNATSNHGVGGGYAQKYGDNILESCLIADNFGDLAGGVYLGYALSQGITLQNTTIANNVAGEVNPDWASGVYGREGYMHFNDCIVYGNTGQDGYNFPQIGDEDVTITVEYSCVQGGYSGNGNISTNPGFTTGPRGDYYLGASPCIDAGSDAATVYGMDQRTTQTSLALDSGTVDMGYHYLPLGGDCNRNGIDDAIDISSGASSDCNGNQVPDECEMVDCNGNNILDECDIAGATSTDCNNNGIPDECEFVDCNNNGIHDACDIVGGTNDDCNTNYIPDDCEWIDCNTNGVLDECDIADGTSDDCNTNSIPDECEWIDCNGNNVLDECDIAGSTSDDCNLNSVPDECDIAGGTSTDTNGNLIPDDCELLFVDDTAPGPDHNGTSWQTAFLTLHEALADSRVTSGVVTEIWVATGTYTPTDDTNDQAASFQLLNNLTIYGGFAGTEDPATFDLATRDFVANETILTGDLQGNDGPNYSGYWENSYHVVNGSGVDATAILDGFTVTGGMAYDDVYWNDTTAAGLLINGGSPTINNCLITYNWALERAGGVLVDSGATPTFTHTTFSHNKCDYMGGGVSIEGTDSRATFDYCTFEYNSVDYPYGAGYGGAISIGYGAHADITNCGFSYNTADGFGGAINIDWNGFTGIIEHCTFDNNATTDADNDDDGGGAIFALATDLTLTDCHFTDNYAYATGGALNHHAGGSGSLTLTDCTFTNNGHDGYCGSAVHAQASTNTVTGCTFDSNQFSYDGGALCFYYQSDSATVTNCTFTGNEADKGAAVDCGCGTTFENCTFTDNTVSGIGDCYGGGAVLQRSGDLVSFTDCTFERNTTDEKGGAVSGDYGPLAFTRCTFTDNQAGDCGGGDAPGGGAVYAYADLSFTDCDFTTNHADGTGGAICHDAGGSGTFTLSGCTFTQNSHDGECGSAVYTEARDNIISACTFTDNAFSYYGGALCIYDDTHTATVSDCVFDGNSGDIGGAVNVGGAETTFTDCEFRNNYTQGGYDCYGGGAVLQRTGDLMTFERCLFEDNHSVEKGGAVSSEYGGLSFTDCQFIGNHADGCDPGWDSPWGGGAIAAWDPVTLINCTFTNNYVDEFAGGAVNVRAYAPSEMTDCTFDGNEAAGSGGAVEISGEGNLIATNCTFTSNAANGTGTLVSAKTRYSDVDGWSRQGSTDGGGAVRVTESEYDTCNGIFTNCLFHGNQAHTAGALMFANAEGNDGNSITDCVFTTNTATEAGGALCVNSCPVTVVNSVFTGNGAGNEGGAVLGVQWDGYNGGDFRNCLLFGNAAARGGGIYLAEGWSEPYQGHFSLTLHNCTIANNIASHFGGGIYESAADQWNYDAVRSNDSILWGNSDSTGTTEAAQIYEEHYDACLFSYSCVENWSRSATHVAMIDLDPQFVTGPFGDYYLSQISAGQATTSPCVDTGSDTAVNLGIDDRTTRTDIVGDGGTVDMGYHYVADFDCNGNGVPDSEDIAEGTSEDTNGDGIPDECITEPDGACCLADGCQILTPSVCAAAGGEWMGEGSHCDDADTDGTANVCEDCNTNGVLDGTDILGGTSADCNGNGIPDECEAPELECLQPVDPQDPEDPYYDVLRKRFLDPADTTVVIDWSAAVTLIADCASAATLTYDIDLDDDASMDVTGATSSSYDFPVGTHRVYVTATDDADGSTATCDFLVYALPFYDEIPVTVEYNRVVVFPTVPVPDTFTRCIEFEVAGTWEVPCPDRENADCNGNGVADVDDIAGGTSTDCNHNDVPDECDVATYTAHLDLNFSVVDANRTRLYTDDGLVLLVPGDSDYGCMRARDSMRTLRRALPLTPPTFPAGYTYSAAEFVSDNTGNAINDFVYGDALIPLQFVEERNPVCTVVWNDPWAVVDQMWGSQEPLYMNPILVPLNTAFPADVTCVDVETARAYQAANDTAHWFEWFNMDLDGDGLYAHSDRQILMTALGRFNMAATANPDLLYPPEDERCCGEAVGGAVSAMALPQPQPVLVDDMIQAGFPEAAQLDLNGDGLLTEKELNAITPAAIDEALSDHPVDRGLGQR